MGRASRRCDSGPGSRTRAWSLARTLAPRQRRRDSFSLGHSAMRSSSGATTCTWHAPGVSRNQHLAALAQNQHVVRGGDVVDRPADRLRRLLEADRCTAPAWARRRRAVGVAAAVRRAQLGADVAQRIHNLARPGCADPRTSAVAAGRRACRLPAPQRGSYSRSTTSKPSSAATPSGDDIAVAPKLA